MQTQENKILDTVTTHTYLEIPSFIIFSLCAREQPMYFLYLLYASLVHFLASGLASRVDLPYFSFAIYKSSTCHQMTISILGAGAIFYFWS